jgi:hypothetical protein
MWNLFHSIPLPYLPSSGGWIGKKVAGNIACLAGISRFFDFGIEKYALAELCSGKV